MGGGACAANFYLSTGNGSQSGGAGGQLQGGLAEHCGKNGINGGGGGGAYQFASTEGKSHGGDGGRGRVLV